MFASPLPVASSGAFLQMRHWVWLLPLSLVLWMGGGLQASPIKVYILAGQSNMEGHARIETFDYLGDDPATAPLLNAMRGPAGRPTVCDGVWISYRTGDENGDFELNGRLTAGFGSLWGQDRTRPGDKIGPEFTFGLTLDAALAEPVLVIKTAWGGKSLHTDFRPPSAGPYVLNEFQRKLYYGPKAHGVPKDMEVWLAEKKRDTGDCYRRMLEQVRKVLADPGRVVPGYDPSHGYELAGFVWLQGWNDMVDGHTYPAHGQPGRFEAYSDLLAHFIRDVRKDLGAPRLPFVIGVMGVDGAKAGREILEFRRAMAAPAALPEFQGTVVAVETAPFWSEELGAIDRKRDQVRQMRYYLDSKHKDHANADGRMTDEQKEEFMKRFEAELISPSELALWKRGASNAGYHYLGCAKTFARMGQAFAQALLAMRPVEAGATKSSDAELHRETRTLAGWKVHISPELLAREPEATRRALELIEAQLQEIIRGVPAPAVRELQQVSIYLSPEYPGVRPTAEYHPDAGWLRANRRDPGMAKAIEITEVTGFETSARRMPMLMLHELAHAYHDRVLPGGHGNSEIQAAYERAKAGGGYERVEFRDADGRTRMERHYALSNPAEYFAEGTEAFFGRNDFFPYTRDELKQHDPELFALLMKLWGAVTPGATPKPQASVAHPVLGGLESHPTLSPRLAGNVLISELGCTACHATSSAALASKAGPDLSEAGSRIDPGHLRRFIADPSGTKPGTTMPNVLAGLPAAEREQAARALATYLASLGTGRLTLETPAGDAIERGRALYHSIGCVACHLPEAPVAGSVPLGPVGDKYSVASLAAFLEDPLAVRPAGRMPDLRLDHFAAVDIASYLVRDRTDPGPGPEVPRDPVLVQRGRELFLQHRCAACHRTEGLVPPPTLAAFDTLNPERGCLSGEPGAWPSYPLSDVQRTAIRAAMANVRDPMSPAETLDLALTRLNCVACHQRGEVGGPGPDRIGYFTGADPNLGESGRLPPPLTGVGAKLKAGALRDAVANGASVRPYLHTRMPRFGTAVAGEWVGLFKQLDTLPPAEFSRVGENEKAAERGRELAGSQGFNCIACHTFRGRSAAPLRALDLMTLAERLEENWFHQYLANPQRFSPQTIMPSFWPDGKSSLPAVLGGDPGRQRDALWQWLEQGPEAGEPRGLVLEPMVVEVKDEAVIIRRAFPGIGKRGIGVGYPAGIHLAFDAGQMRLGSIWSGGFIEASGLWRGQGAGQAGIRGRDRVDFPSGVAFAVLESAATPWPTNQARQPQGFAFQGYWLDAQRRPTFRYEAAGLRVSDAFLDVKGGDGKPHFVRTLELSQPPPPGLHFRVAADPVIEALGAGEYAVGKRLRVRLSAPGVVRDAADSRELLLPVTGPFTVEYHLHDNP